MNTSTLTNIKSANPIHDFVADLQQSSYFERVCAPIENCVFAYICGSQATGLAEQNSDIDIVVVLKDDESRNYTGEGLLYKHESGNIKVQWFPMSISQFFTGVDEPMVPRALTLLGMFQWGTVDCSYIFYKNPEYEYIFNNFLLYKKEIQQLGILKYCNYYSILLNLKQIPLSQVESSHPTIARFCYMADYLEHGNHLLNKNIVADIKRQRNFQEHLPYIRNRIAYLKQYISNCSVDIESETNRLINLMYEGGINYATREKENI